MYKPHEPFAPQAAFGPGAYPSNRDLPRTPGWSAEGDNLLHGTSVEGTVCPFTTPLCSLGASALMSSPSQAFPVTSNEHPDGMLIPQSTAALLF